MGELGQLPPGAVLPPADWPPERWDQLAAQAPLERTGSPQDVLGAVLYLAAAEFVTGVTIHVDGGRILDPGGHG